MPNPLHPLHNPAAGEHPLPQDPREIEAVIRAGSRCYAVHPYFAERYGERGLAFMRSDGGYLATLADHPQSQVNEQVLWLAGVLANRGMPRWLMEAHLELLQEDLCAAVPERAPLYLKLGQAAQVLREARQRWIRQSEFEGMAAAFDKDAGGGLRGAGALVLAAVCDEASGLSEAVPSLTKWLCDSSRFSPQWCDAVTETLSWSRALAARSSGQLP